MLVMCKSNKSCICEQQSILLTDTQSLRYSELDTLSHNDREMTGCNFTGVSHNLIENSSSTARMIFSHNNVCVCSGPNYAFVCFKRPYFIMWYFSDISYKYVILTFTL